MQTFLLFLAAVTASPDAPAGNAESPAASKSAKGDKDKVICRRRQMTATRMGSAQPICMTKAAWEEARKISNKAAGTVSAHNGTNRTSEGISGMGLPPVPGGE